MKYSTLTKSQDGSYYSSIRDDDDQPMIVRMDNVKTIEEYLDSDDDIWFAVGDGDKPTKLETVEGDVLSHIKSDPVKWFGKKVREKTIESSFISHLSQHGEIQFAKSPGLKLFNKETKEPWTETLTPEDDCDILIQIQGLNFFKRSFQLVLKLHQVQVSPKVETKNSDICHDEWVMEEYGFHE